METGVFSATTVCPGSFVSNGFLFCCAYVRYFLKSHCRKNLKKKAFTDDSCTSYFLLFFFNARVTLNLHTFRISKSSERVRILKDTFFLSVGRILSFYALSMKLQ